MSQDNASLPHIVRGRRISIWRWVIIASLFCGTAVVAVGVSYWYYYTSYVTRVNLTNEGEDSLVDVVLHVSGKSYSVGTIPAKGSIVVHVVPKYDSHLEIEFTSPVGDRKNIDAGGYFGPSIPADIWIEMDAGTIRSRNIQYRR